MRSPLVSVIVPNYNHKPFLEQRIKSILNQAFEDFELILLDDCSSDESILILDKYKNHPKVRAHIYNKVNTGKPILQWERGIANANGEFVWIAESDDYSDSDFLKHSVEFLRKNIDAGLVYSQSLDVDSEGKHVQHRINYTDEFKPNIWKNNFIIEGTEFINSYMKVKNVIPNASAVVFRKSLVESSFFRDDSIANLKMCADWLFWIKLVRKTRVGFLKEPRNFFRIHKSVSRNHISIDRQKQRIVEEVYVRNYLEKIKGLTQKSFLIILFEKWLRLSQSSFRSELYIMKKLKNSNLRLLFLSFYFRNKLKILRSISRL